MKSKPDIADQFRRHKSSSEKGLADQWANTRDCQAFYAGNQMQYSDTVTYGGLLGPTKTTTVQFNLVKPYVNSVRGFMAQNRRVAEYVARMPDNQMQGLYSEYANALKDYIRETANADQIETQQDGDLLINGYGAVEFALTYGDGYSTRNPNGEVVAGRLDPRTVGWDPTARAPNLLDSRWVYYKKVYPLDEALDLIDGSDESDFEAEHDWNEGNKVFNPRGGKYDKVQYLGRGADDDLDWENEDDELVKVYFYQWYEIEKYYRAKNPLKAITDPQAAAYFDMEMQDIAAEQDQDDDYRFDPRADIITCNAATKKEIDEIFEDATDWETFKRRAYYTAVISGSKVFTAYRSKYQQGFTVKFKTGDFDEENRVWFGMVNSLKDPVTYYNKALTNMMFTIAAQAKGGVYIERDAVDDIGQFERDYAKTDSVIEVNEGALAGGKIQAKKETYTANGLDTVISIAQGALPDVTGIDKNFLGSSENKMETAQLNRQRIRQVTTALATYFDNISLYQKENASLLIPMMRTLCENNDGSMFEAFSDSGDIQMLMMSPDNLADDYFISLQEAPDSATTKDETGAMLSTLGAQFLSSGDAATGKALIAKSLKYSDLEFKDVQDLIQILTPPNGPPPIDPQYVQQLEDQIKVLQGQGAEAELKEKLSKAQLNMLTGEEKIANIRKINAGISKTNADTDQTRIETQIARTQPATDVRVTA